MSKPSNLDVSSQSCSSEPKNLLCRKYLTLKSVSNSIFTVSSVAQSCPTLATAWTPLSVTSYQSLLRLMSVELVMSSDHLFLRRPLLLYQLSLYS